MSQQERAVLAGGCFWGMQDLIRKMDGVISTRVGYSGGDVANATYRHHGTHAEAIEVIFDPARLELPQAARILLPGARPDHPQPPGQRRRHELPLGDLLPPATSRSGSPRTRSPTSMPRASGRAASSPRWRRRARSGRPSPSTRTTCSGSRTATPATSCGRAGSCRCAKPRARPGQRLRALATQSAMAEPELPNDALSKAIAALEAQRPVLGSAIVDAALAPLLAQQQATHRTAPPRRRQVSVLFLDVVGSTALSQTIDPEDLLDIMDSALQSFSARVAERGGKVLQYAGDSLLAAFGAETAREDDAERAVLAGLDLLAEARLQAERIERTHGQSGFQVRVGIHTGHVLLGGGVDDEGTIRGFTVNIAARLEQTAPPGSLRISQETWRHVRGVFDFEAQPPLQVKGQDEPLRTWLVLRAKPRAFRVATRGIEGTETPLVGRDAELAQLVAAFEATLQTRNAPAPDPARRGGAGQEPADPGAAAASRGLFAAVLAAARPGPAERHAAAVRTAARRARLAAADRRRRQRRGGAPPSRRRAGAVSRRARRAAGRAARPARGHGLLGQPAPRRRAQGAAPAARPRPRRVRALRAGPVRRRRARRSW